MRQREEGKQRWERGTEEGRGEAKKELEPNMIKRR